jgi:thiopurine S-methyltransferase
MFQRPLWKASSLVPVTASVLLIGPSTSYYESRTLAEAAPDNSDRLAGWKHRWETANTAWQKHTTHPSLLQFVDTHLLKNQKNARVLVPLCGKSVDLAYLASHVGVSTVVGVEGVRQGIEEFSTEQPHLGMKEEEASAGSYKRWVGNRIVLLNGDFLALNASTAGGRVSGVWDRGALVAVDPSIRPAYVQVLGNVIAPGGVILLSAFVRPNGDVTTGPPFSIDEDEVRRLFGNLSWVESIECVETKNLFWSEPSWYTAFAAYYRLGNVSEKVFVIKAK